MTKPTFFLACFFLTAHFALGADWATNLVWSGGGVWIKRFAVSVENRSSKPMVGTPVAITPQPFPAKELRLTKADGTELLYGLMPDGTILIPVEAEPGQKAEYYIYFGNPQAEAVPDMLEAKLEFVNGDMELGNEEGPDGWYMDEGNATHHNYWVTENPQSGAKCLKTVVEPGAQSDWTATRQSGIPIIGGATYQFKAWVSGENVEGNAGWFFHVGNEKNTQLINRVINGGSGTFGWKEIVSEFTAPDESDSMIIGTVLYGTGTAWFDNVSFKRIDHLAGTPVQETADGRRQTVADHHLAGTPLEPKIVIGNVEEIPYTIIPADSDWKAESRLKDGKDYLCRSTFRLMNTTDSAMKDVPVLMTLRGSQAHGLLGPLTDVVLDDGLPVAVLDEENFRLSCTVSVPAKTVKYFNVYYRFLETAGGTTPTPPQEGNIHSPPVEGAGGGLLGLGNKSIALDSDTAHPELQKAVDPFAELPNLVKNGTMEQGTNFPDDWNRNETHPPVGVRYSLETSPELVLFGKQCLRLDIAKTAPTSWRGWTQQIEVKPNHNYLVQGWMKGIDISPARIHLHFHDSDGKLCVNGGMSSINQDIAGTTDWTRVAEIITTPSDARFMTLHLTTDGIGSLLHDNMTVIDGLFAEQIDRESYCNGDIHVWQVPAVMKVFPQTIPTDIPRMFTDSYDGIERAETSFGVLSASNEKEPLQLAIRSATARKLNIKVSPLKIQVVYLNRVPHMSAESGVSTDKMPPLTDFAINTVGYVKVDYPSNYYNTTTPKWYRMSPTSAPACDGWGGLFPNPLLPTDTIDMKPNQTESVWITWTIPRNTPSGVYSGTIELLENGVTIYEFSVTFRVWDFALPDENHLSAIYDVRLGPGGSKYWGGDEKTFHKEIVELMTDNRLSPDTVMPSPGLSFKEGKPVFDWTEFDKVADWYFNERHVRQAYTPWLLYCFGWGHPPTDFYGEKPYPGEWPFKDADFSKIRPEYKAKYQAVLREFWNHITAKGWAEKFILYVSDEPNYWTPEIIAQMKAVCEMIHEVDAKIPIYCSTWRHVPEWDDSLDVWGIGHYGIVPMETMKQIKAHGSRLWFTTDGMLCLDTPYNAIERLLPYYCFKYGADAYEFWGVGWLTYDPYKYGSHAYIHQSSTPGEYYWVRYPNGDGYMIYPPQKRGGKIVSSVRFEQAREGVEDFEYFYLLSQLIEKGRREGKDVSQGESALAEALNLVENPTAIGRFSSKILPNPYKIYEVRRRVADAIEALNR